VVTLTDLSVLGFPLRAGESERLKLLCSRGALPRKDLKPNLGLARLAVGHHAKTNGENV